MPPSIDRTSMNHSSSDQNFLGQIMQNGRGVNAKTSMRAKSRSSRRGRVSFSDTSLLDVDDEKKVEDKNTQSYRKVSRRAQGKGKRVAANTEKENMGTAETSPKGSFMSGLGRRLSSRFSDKRKGFVKCPDDAVEEDEDGGEDDPVMTIFESRNTQRVRFTLECVEERAPEEKKGVVPEKQSGVNIRQFMSRALFGSSKSSKKLNEEMEREVAALGGGSLVWESAETPTGPEVIHTTSDEKQTGAELMLSFTEDSKARAIVVKLLNKARRAEHIHFRYEYAVKCYLKALGVLKKANYPDDHPTVIKTVRLLNHAHHVLSSYNNSAGIVKIGIKYEDAGELVRALKMYTIAYRIRRDNLSRNHPSLVVLLNMLGSTQIKRGELKEAMQIYELALNDSPVIFNANQEEDGEIQPPTGNLLANSVTYREIGTIHERWGNLEKALKLYHKSLECVAEWRAVRGSEGATGEGTESDSRATNLEFSIDDVQVSWSSSGDCEAGEAENGEMELSLGPVKQINTENIYESFFPRHLDDKLENSSSVSNNDDGSRSSRDSHADMDLALTLHQIAQLHCCQGKHSKALDAYEVALRGMKCALGKHHPNVAAVLGNIGNLQKEMGLLDAAYNTYQEVLGIESYRLGLSHPDVAITLHNIATIDAARGNFDHALQLYRKVIGLQKKLFGQDHLSVAVTAACMGDVYERVGEFRNSIDSYEDALRIKSAALGSHSLDVARILHKLGKLSFRRADHHMADSFISRAVLIYRLNKVSDDHEWVVDANRDTANIDAAIAMDPGQSRHFEF